MPGSEEPRTDGEWQPASAWYRTRPGVGWLAALAIVPLLIALIAWIGGSRVDQSSAPTSPKVDPTASLTPSPPSPATSSRAPAGAGSNTSIVRKGTSFTVSGALPDEDTRQGLIDTLKLALPGAALIEQLVVVPGVAAPEAAALGGLFGAALEIPDFALRFDGATTTLTGTAPNEAVKASAAEYAAKTWPNAQVRNDIVVKAAGSCATLPADVTGLQRTAITFVTDGFALSPAARTLVGRIADRVKACPGATVTVTGYTDSTGSDAINVPLSGDRAKAVVSELVADGVAPTGVTARGAGAADPVASNATPEGRALNRRAQIAIA